MGTWRIYNLEKDLLFGNDFLTDGENCEELERRLGEQYDGDEFVRLKKGGGRWRTINDKGERW